MSLLPVIRIRSEAHLNEVKRSVFLGALPHTTRVVFVSFTNCGLNTKWAYFNEDLVLQGEHLGYDLNDIETEKP